MLFIEPFFLVVFLPLVLVSLWQISKNFGEEAGLGLLLLCSVLFYLKFGVGYCLLLLISISINFFVGVYLCGLETRSSWRGCALALGLAWNFGTLFYFKYWGYLGAVFTPAGLSSSAVDFAIPVGISFYTFHQAVFL